MSEYLKVKFLMDWNGFAKGEVRDIFINMARVWIEMKVCEECKEQSAQAPITHSKRVAGPREKPS